MTEDRRTFLKTAFGAGVVGAGVVLQAKYGLASSSAAQPADSNGVALGHSPKKEVLYKKTAHWDLYYKSSY